MEKKVILFIVEGPSDEAALNSAFKEHFNNPSHRFQIVQGDITSELDSNPRNIKRKVALIIKRFMDRYRYRKIDILQVIQLVDTDGVFIPDDKLIHHPTHHLRYENDCILTNQESAIQERNSRKRSNINSLIHCKDIAGCPYKMLYLSRHLEHVLYNMPEPNPSQKMSLADQFGDDYAGRLPDFIKLLSDPAIAPEGGYLETWQFIQQGTNSLHRHSNLHLLFDPEQGIIACV